MRFCYTANILFEEYMKFAKKYRSLLLGLILFLSLIPHISAHVVKIEGTIGVTLHISPDDEPVAGETAALFIEIHDQQQQFVATDTACDCRVSIAGKENTIAALPFVDEKGYVKLEYTFPESGTYKIIVRGTPRPGSFFQSYEAVFSYFVRPASSEDRALPLTTSNANTLQFWFPFLVLGSIILILLMFFIPASLYPGSYDKKSVR